MLRVLGALFGDVVYYYTSRENGRDGWLVVSLRWRDDRRPDAQTRHIS